MNGQQEEENGQDGDSINCVLRPQRARACRTGMKFAIVTDSSADLAESYAAEQGIHVVPFYVSMDGVNYLKEGREIPVPDFYKAMIEQEDCYPKTSMPTIPDYLEEFRPLAQAGMPILCICLTQKFSGSYQSAVNASLALKDEFPGCSIQVIDSQLVTALQGLFVSEAVRLRDSGLSLEEAVPLLEGIRSSGQIFFTTKDLKYLEHGGRLGKVASIAGSVLNLKPILRFEGGELGTAHVCRGRKKSLMKIVDDFFEYLRENDLDLSGYWFGTGIGADIPEYEEFCRDLEERFEATGIRPDDWVKVRIGATIGVHTGPYPMGLGILKKCEIK